VGRGRHLSRRPAHRPPARGRYYYRLRTNGTIVQTTNYFTTLRAPVDPGDVFFTVVDDWGEETSGEANVAKSWPATPADLPLRATLVLRHAERDDPPVRRGDVPRPVSGIYLHASGSTLRCR
jgi:hypothetical protein